MVKINEEKQFIVSKESLAQILEQYSIKDFEFQIFESGIANVSIKIISKNQASVLRIYQHGNKSDESILLELEFQDYLRKNKLPIPRIYKNLKGQELTKVKLNGINWQMILMEFKEGILIDEYHTEKVLIQLAQIQAKMHLLGIEFAKHHKDHGNSATKTWATRNQIEIPQEYDQEFGPFIQRAEKFEIKTSSELPSGYNHFDLDLHGNVLIDNDQISAILDFDDLSYASCVICLGYTLWDILATLGWDDVNFYLNEYQKFRKLTSAELVFLPQAMLLRNYVIGILELTLWKNLESVKKTVEFEKQIMVVKFYE